MVRVGDFELRLVCADGRPCPEVEHNGRWYAVASPGSAFVVQLTWHNNRAFRPAAGALLSASLDVDGQSVGYDKALKKPCVTAFEGWLKEGDMHSMTYQGFVFRTPQESEDKQAESLHFEEGTIKSQVFSAMQTMRENSQRYYGPAQANDSVAKMPEGKKFFMAPSLTTGKGEVKHGGGMSRYQTHRVGPALATLELRYETAATLLLRGVLKEGDPRHAAILQQCTETAPKHEPEQAGGSAGEPEASAAGRPRAAAGRKRQRQDAAGQQQEQAQRRRQQQEELIDLTKVPAEGDEVLAAKAKNEALECDLTGDDVPAWRAVKLEVHHIA